MAHETGGENIVQHTKLRQQGLDPRVRALAGPLDGGGLSLEQDHAQAMRPRRDGGGRAGWPTTHHHEVGSVQL
jgi:hypothetical protein